MKINIESIKKTLGATMTTEVFISLEDKEIQGQKISFIKPGELELRVINVDQEYVIVGTAKFLLKLACSRCLEKFNMPFEFELNEEVSKEEVADDEIDLKPIILKDIHLNLAIQNVCDEDCQGLCPSCGINLNEGDCDCIMHKVDPRLAKLEKLLED